MSLLIIRARVPQVESLARVRVVDGWRCEGMGVQACAPTAYEAWLSWVDLYNARYMRKLKNILDAYSKQF